MFISADAAFERGTGVEAGSLSHCRAAKEARLVVREEEEALA